MKNEKFINVVLTDKEIDCIDMKLSLFEDFIMFRKNDKLYLALGGITPDAIEYELEGYHDLFNFIIGNDEICYEDLMELYDKTVELNNKIEMEDAQIGNKKLENRIFSEKEIKFFENYLDEYLYSRKNDLTLINLAKKGDYMYVVLGSIERKIGECKDCFNFIDENGTMFYAGALLECYEKSYNYLEDLKKKEKLSTVTLNDEEMDFVKALLFIFDKDDEIWIHRSFNNAISIEWDSDFDSGNFAIPKFNHLFKFLEFAGDVYSIKLSELSDLYDRTLNRGTVPTKPTENQVLDLSFLKTKSNELLSTALDWCDLWSHYSKSDNSTFLGMALQNSLNDISYDSDILYNLVTSLSHFDLISPKQLLDICSALDEINSILNQYDFVKDMFF